MVGVSSIRCPFCRIVFEKNIEFTQAGYLCGASKSRQNVDQGTEKTKLHESVCNQTNYVVAFSDFSPPSLTALSAVRRSEQGFPAAYCVRQRIHEGWNLNAFACS